MYFSFNSFCFLSVLNYYVATKGFREFTFKAMALGHSGLLITWEPTETPCSMFDELCEMYTFEFGKGIVGKNTNESIENSGSEYSYFSQYKVYSLIENTDYEVVIKQFRSNNRSKELKIYSVKTRTNVKTNSIPAKPSFEYSPPVSFFRMGQIKWFPCGKEKNCHDKEPGTHFGIHIRELDSLSKSSDVNEEVLLYDYYGCLLWPERLYEVEVYSINEFTPVQHVNVLSLPNSSVLISWKPPKHSLELLDMYLVYCYDPRKLPSDVSLLDENLISTYWLQMTFEQMKRRGLEHGVTYTCNVSPVGLTGIGFEFRMKHTLQVYDDNLPIAKPDFNYKFSYDKDGRCQFYFQWLPCGQSFDCKNNKPGSDGRFEITPEPPNILYKDEKEYYCGAFEENVIYQVTLKSAIGNNFSEPVTKKFKDCSIYKKSG